MFLRLISTIQSDLSDKSSQDAKIIKNVVLTRPCKLEPLIPSWSDLLLNV